MTVAMMPGAFVLRCASVFLILLSGTARAQQPSATVAGTVSVTAPDGQSMFLPGVTLTLTCPGAPERKEVSNEQGAFRFDNVSAGSGVCAIVADLEGFRSSSRTLTLKGGDRAAVALELGLDTLQEDVTVRGNADAAGESTLTAHVERMSAETMRMAPIGGRFQDALPLIPGVLRGPDGLLNISGARRNQSAVTFNSADGTDPVTGEDSLELPIDAVSSVQVRGAAYAPEFGLSAGVVTTVETVRAGDAWRVTLNDLEPRVRRRGGAFRGLESFTPRITVGGPIVKRRLTLLQSAQYEYSQTRVFGLPPSESDTKVQSFESFSRADWTASQTNRFTGVALVSPRKTTYAGLNTFNPQPVTPTITNHNVLGSASDQIVAGAAALLETRVSVKQSDTTIDPSRGDGPMVLAPDTNAGAYFNTQDRRGRRVEWLTTYAFAPFGPTHTVKLGAGVTRELFSGISENRPVAIVREDGTPSQQIAFTGSGRLDRGRTAVQGYAQDAWTAGPRATVQYGARYDYESVTGRHHIAPRVSVSVLASADGRTVVRGGAGVFYHALPLNVATFEQLQRRVVTSMAPDGSDASGRPVELPNIVASDLRTPRSLSWNLQVERQVIERLFVRAGFQQRENRSESVIDLGPLPDGSAATILRTDGRSRYREGQVTARYQIRGADEIVASYTRASAVGNLNDFNSFFGNLENPVVRPDARGPLPWDVPNRVLVWGSVSLSRGFALFPVLDVRDGFPVSNLDADRNFVGPRNRAGRYPTFVSLDTQLTKKLRVFHHQATIGLKVFNVTNHFNPRDYQGNVDSRDFGGFNNSVGRTFRGKWVFEF
ncbi:MAG: hypothetical protein DMF86_05655 [Acidobacteria bacterium]|nr:MAG: hypothetical protein DMF86_05655 [Acidobacteriota bacterium]